VVYLTDRVSWIVQLFDQAVAQQAAYAPARVATTELQRACVGSLDSITTVELRRRLDQVRARLEQVLRENEMNAVVHSDLVLLKDLYVRCRNEVDRRERS
jgi:hypothetical protein